MTKTHPTKPDYYQLLHVQQDAPLPVIRASYRALMQKLKQHPDLGGSHTNAAALNEAYAVLSSQTQRQLYDTRQARQPNSLQQPGNRAHNASIRRCLFCNTNNQQSELCSNCKSPLQRVVEVTGLPEDQRSLRRLPKLGELALQTHWQEKYFSGQCQDLTPRGMRLRTLRQLRVNSVVRIKSDICHAVARVAHASANRSHWSYGVEFLTLAIEQPLGRFVATQA